MRLIWCAALPHSVTTALGTTQQNQPSHFDFTHPLPSWIHFGMQNTVYSFEGTSQNVEI